MEPLERHFDTAFAAPGGIKKLRELILSLAMQGKLVEQDKSDKPASELLQEIETEKKRLVKVGKIKKSKPMPEIKAEKVPHELPEGWEWVRLGDVGLVTSSSRVHQRDWMKEGVPFYRAREIVKLSQIGFVDNELFISEEHYQFIVKDKIVPEANDLMITGVGTIGVPYIVKKSDRFYFKDASVLIFKNLYGLYAPFLFQLFKSPFWVDRIHVGSMGTTVHTLTIERTNEILIPLPPVEEQHRIVAKIDQLMARCDKLEKLRTEKEQKRLEVHTAALRKLLDAQEQDSFANAWQFVTRNFGDLYSVKENVAELRKAILQLAVMGKLVKQDPNDPPASDLLKEIEAEKSRLVKEGEIRKPKPLQEIKTNEVPYALPNGWKWVRLSTLAQSIEYGTSQKTCDDSSLVPVYRMGNIVNGKLVDENFKYISPEIKDLPRLYLQTDDILFNRTNSYELVGKTAIFHGKDNFATLASYLIRVRLFKRRLLPAYITMAMNAPYFRSTQIVPEIVQQCGQANFNGTKLSLCLIPLPPLAAQHRIVAKFDQLMTFCDDLEQQIKAKTSTQNKLLNAVMALV